MFVNFPVYGFCCVLDGVDKLFIEGRGFCSGVIAGLSWKVTMVFGCEGGFFPLR